MEIGDIVLVETYPPHIASVVGPDLVLCEDGTHLPTGDLPIRVLYTALQIVQELEKGVLNYHDAG